MVKTYQYIILMKRDDSLGLLSVLEDDYKVWKFWYFMWMVSAFP